MDKPKYLRSLTNGVIFPWNEHQANMPNMVPVEDDEQKPKPKRKTRARKQAAAIQEHAAEQNLEQEEIDFTYLEDS